jgi:hypothetical protein
MNVQQCQLTLSACTAAGKSAQHSHAYHIACLLQQPYNAGRNSHMSVTDAEVAQALQAGWIRSSYLAGPRRCSCHSIISFNPCVAFHNGSTNRLVTDCLTYYKPCRCTRYSQCQPPNHTAQQCQHNRPTACCCTALLGQRCVELLRLLPSELLRISPYASAQALTATVITALANHNTKLPRRPISCSTWLDHHLLPRCPRHRQPFHTS